MATLQPVDFDPFASDSRGKIRDGIKTTARSLGIDPVDLATAISYETGGTFDPKKSGPKTQWGQHRGLIQFGEPQAKQYGVDWNNPVESQLGEKGAVANYLRAAGVKPGMGLMDVYSAINAGAPGRYEASDSNNGGAPGTVRDKVGRQMGAHRAKAAELVGPKLVPVDFDPFAEAKPTEAPKAPTFMQEVKDSLPVQAVRGVSRGAKDVIDTGAELLATGYDKLRGNSLSNLVAGGEADRVRRMNAAGKAEYEAGLPQGDGVDASIARGGAIVGRIGGNIAATLPVTGAAGAGLVAAGLPRLGNALATGGMATGATVAKTAPLAAKAADLGIRTAGGVAAGGVSAGLVDPDSAVLGAAIGGALPGFLKGAGAAGNFLGESAKGVYQMTNRGASNAAVHKAADAVGDVPQAIADIQTHFPKGAESIPLSAAAITKSPALARLEQGSRLKTTEPWYTFDQKQGAAVFDNVMKATKDADELSARVGQRAENWRDAWAKANDATKPKLWKWGVERLRLDLDQAAVSAEAMKPGVRNVVDQLRRQIDEVGDGFTPAHLQQIRAELNGRVKPLSASAYESAPRDTPAIISLKQELDRILNASTGGKWQKVIEGYAKDSKGVHEAKAADRVRASFMDKDTGRLLSADPTDSFAKITDAGLSRSMNAAREPRTKNLILSGDAEQRLTATVDALRSQGIVQSVKRSASAGGGSDTKSNLIASAGGNFAARNAIRGALESLQKYGTAKTDAELARLLSNPDDLANAFSKLTIKQKNAFRMADTIIPAVTRAAPVLAANR